jgi:hypothetical protein
MWRNAGWMERTGRTLRALMAACGVALVLAACDTNTTAVNTGTATPVATVAGTTGDVAAVDPNYIYNQLFYLATHFLRREAGYDNGLPPGQNGHDEFAAYWTQEITKDLAGFGPTARTDPFSVQGWSNRPATVSAFNQEVSVPGITHPDQVVVIGCHYDGMAFSSQSANDDASGCAIELGIAKAMGAYWRAHHTYPARTLRFVLFDAEEQGLFGSFHYVNTTVNGDLGNIVAMFNEEQNGIAYPLRYLGKTSNPLLPYYLDLSPLSNNQLYPTQDQLPQSQHDAITRFRALMAQAVPAVFAEFRALGDGTLTYHNDQNQPVNQAIFTPADLTTMQAEDDTLGSSDQVPFTMAGLPCATLVGNSTYYDPSPPPWSYPYDQPQDTIQLMNTFASGRSSQSQALTLALALPGMLTAWMLSQPDVLGQAPADGKPLAAMSDIGQAVAGQSLALDAQASFDPAGGALSYQWGFGDGATASGIAVSHTYSAPGSYKVTLAVQGTGGTRTVTKTINVLANAIQFPNPYGGFSSDGMPPSNPAVTLPTPGPA